MIDLARPLRIAVGIMFAAVVALVGAQIVFRYVLGDPLVWSDELARLLLVWLVFLGAAALVWDGRHLDVDVVFRLLPPRGRRALRLFNSAIVALFLAALSWGSLEVIELEGFAEMSALGISRAWLRLPALVGGGLMLVLLGLRLVLRWREDTTL